MSHDIPSNFYEMTITDFLKIAASNSHVPGGGNVSAVVATLGASMGAMVASLTEGKKGYEEHQAANASILKAFMAGIENLKQLTKGDVDTEPASQIARAITPVPGGVGSLTTTVIMQNLLKAVELQGLI